MTEEEVRRIQVLDPRAQFLGLLGVIFFGTVAFGSALLAGLLMVALELVR